MLLDAGYFITSWVLSFLELTTTYHVSVIKLNPVMSVFWTPRSGADDLPKLRSAGNRWSLPIMKREKHVRLPYPYKHNKFLPNPMPHISKNTNRKIVYAQETCRSEP
ncbi:hypothetical protein ACJMK2_015895 [Sinanodonta woodiana]|uniref:Uncharacterized protein n=1 Tax=Sinanodonta woodiana TaxID=1069815 RepID=A0ABD3UV13_SINWO